MTKKDCQNRIRVVLADKQITNRWFAEQMGVTDMTVSRWKTNKIQPSMTQFVEIARLLQVDIKALHSLRYCSHRMTEVSTSLKLGSEDC